MIVTGISPTCEGCRVVRRFGVVKLIHPGDKPCANKRPA